MIRAKETLRVDRGLVEHGRERDGSRLALATRLRRVDEDAEDPRLERRPAFEAVEPAEHAEPGVLDDLLGDGARAHERLGDPEHRRAVALDELHERLLVTIPQPFDERAVVHGRGL